MFFKIDGRLPSLNEYLSACNRSYYVGGKMKKEVDEMIGWFILSAKQNKTLYPTDAPITLRFRWYEKTKRRDPDNIVSAKKFILDALQKQGTIPAIVSNLVRSFGFTTLITLVLPAIFGGEVAWFTFGIYEALSFAFAVVLLKFSERNGIIYK